MSVKNRNSLEVGTELVLEKEDGGEVRFLIERKVFCETDGVSYIGTVCDTEILFAQKAVIKEYNPQMEYDSTLLKKQFPFTLIAKGNHTIYAYTDVNEVITLCELRERRISLTGRDIARIMYSVCESIQKVHERGRLYLNCCPDSIYFLCSEKAVHGTAHLFSFEAAKKQGDVPDHQYHPCMDGWAPIEQIHDEKRYIDVQTDVYAVGAVFLWMMTGKCVDEKSDHDNTDSSFLLNNFPEVLERSGEIADLIKEILTKSLHGAYSSRYLNMAKMKQRFKTLARKYDEEEKKAAAMDSLTDKAVENDAMSHGFKAEEKVYLDIRVYQVADADECSEGRVSFFNGIRGVNYFNGDYYEGEWRGGQFHGDGMYRWENGATYEGYWKNGRQDGFGQFKFINGDVYEGEWKDGLPHGKGKYIEAAGGIYEGEFIYNRPKVHVRADQRATFTREHPPEYAVFNSIIDNAQIGDEREFVRIAEKGSKGAYSRDIVLEAGKQYEIIIYFYNDASEIYNDKNHEYAGVAREAKIISFFPHSLKAGERKKVPGKITASNTQPKEVSDFVYVTARESITLHYVTGSARIYNQWEKNGSVLSVNLFQEGVLIGTNALNGIILGGESFSGHIVYTIQTKAVNDSDSDDAEKKTVKYSDGAIYQGQLIDGLPAGEGTVIFPTGAKYEGSWKNGAYNGWGKFYFATNDIWESYEGMWADGRMEGKGKLTRKTSIKMNCDNGIYETQESYCGVWRQGKKQGPFVHMLFGLPFDEEYENDKKIVCPMSYKISTEPSSLTGKTIKCWHSDQCGFMIETPSTTLLFDWYRREIPSIPGNKPLHIFISNTECCHCNFGMFELAEKFPDAYVYLGCDPSDDIDLIMDRYSDKAEISRFYGNQHLYTDFGEVKSLQSTDMGVAFLVAVDGMTLYHAGLLALWGWGNTSAMTEIQFKDYTEPLRGMHIDYAMLPMDPRTGGNGEQTVEYYLKLADVTCFTPMHLWGNYDYIGAFAKHHPSCCEKMIAVNTQNIQMKCTIIKGEPYIVRF